MKSNGDLSDDTVKNQLIKMITEFFEENKIKNEKRVQTEEAAAQKIDQHANLYTSLFDKNRILAWNNKKIEVGKQLIKYIRDYLKKWNYEPIKYSYL